MRPADAQGIKQLSNLVGEVYSKDYDPQEQTDVQRTWLYTQDPAVRAVNNGMTGQTQLQMYDNATSLPLGEGYQSQMEFKDEVGAFRRIRTEITMNKNNFITRK